jgi:hypothetical protein
MSIFNFGKKQRLHTQLVGNTSGKELFKVDEYNKRKKGTMFIIGYEFLIATLFYFYWNNIQGNVKLYLIFSMIGTFVFGFFNFKQQKILREGLYT